MSVHPSLSSSGTGFQQRSVLKRHERIKQLIGKGKLEEKDSVYGLPKTKTLKIKVKKTKAASKEETEEKAKEDKTQAAPAANGNKAEKK